MHGQPLGVPCEGITLNKERNFVNTTQLLNVQSSLNVPSRLDLGVTLSKASSKLDLGDLSDELRDSKA